MGKGYVKDVYYDDYDITESEEEEDDEDKENKRNDPDWHYTPLIRKRLMVNYCILCIISL